MNDYKDENTWLMQCDCLERMKEIPDGSVDLILTDPPYGTTACKWDSVINLDVMWIEVKRVVKKGGVILLFGAEPFSSTLRTSNISQFKYDWIWVKSRALGFQNSKLRPMTKHEIISVFSDGNCANRASNLMTYNPQGLIHKPKKVSGLKSSRTDVNGHRMERPNHKDTYIQEYTGYPSTVLEYNNEGKTVHPTQKPVALMEYLIKTYTNEGETVLDFTFGSGTTGVAALGCSRKFIGIEMDENYYQVAKDRILNDN